MAHHNQAYGQCANYRNIASMNGVRLTFWIVLISVTVQAQSAVTGVTVPIDLLKKHVYLLTSDSLQGRETGKQGQREAAGYCTQVFRKSHLAAVFRKDSTIFSFQQTYPFISSEIMPYGMVRQDARRAERSTMSVYKRYELTDAPANHRDSVAAFYGQNVAGLHIGTDLKQELVIVSAHYDHLGRVDGQVYPGADDNASGTASVLSIAATFDSLARAGIRSRRSVLFVLFSGEEGGLIGSSYFVANFPMPLNPIICDLNIDMVGRVDDAHRKKPDYCYIIAGLKDDTLRKTVAKANRQSVGLELSRAYDTESDPHQYFYRSDHYNFAKRGIPVLFFMDGEHPDYHKPTDTADRINYEVLQKRATLVFQTAWLMAND
jgi:Peptidase family M28